MTLLIPFARRRSDGLMVDALAVASGKNCDCECPGCNKQVVARHCTVKTSHFAHMAMTACEGALESSLHAAAKQAIMELGFVWLPESLAGKSTKFVFARGEIEPKRDRIRPDLILYTKAGKPLAVEIFVTHELGVEKEEHLRKLKLACVEYHLNFISRDLTYVELKRMFAENEVSGVWAYNEKAAAVAEQRAKVQMQRIEREEAEQRAVELRQQAELQVWLGSPHARARALPVQEISGRYYITSCPIRRRGAVEAFKGLAFADTDCPDCPYCVGRTMPQGIPTEVRCIGHFPKLALKDHAIIRQFGGGVPEREASWQMRPSGIGVTNREPDPF